MFYDVGVLTVFLVSIGLLVWIPVMTYEVYVHRQRIDYFWDFVDRMNPKIETRLADLEMNIKRSSKAD